MCCVQRACLPQGMTVFACFSNTVFALRGDGPHPLLITTHALTVLRHSHRSPMAYTVCTRRSQIVLVVAGGLQLGWSVAPGRCGVAVESD